MVTKNVCAVAMAGSCECEGDECQGKIIATFNPEENPDHAAFKEWLGSFGTPNVPVDAYTKEGLAQAAFFAGMRYQYELFMQEKRRKNKS